MQISLRVAVFSIAFALTTAPSLAQPTLEAAYVLLGGGGAVARTVYTRTTDCAALTIDGATQTMSVRMAPQTGDDARFPVLVCELAIPAGANAVALNGQPLPLPPATGRLSNVAVIGDTGCRLKAGKEKNPRDKDYEEGGKFQDCKSEWPFSALASSVADSKPQLLVHVGDYIYRESRCPHHDKGCKGSPYGDNWATWKADFFDPAKPLLAAAPWIAARGNHEICSRNGTGFMLFLDPTLAANQQPAPCGALLDSFSVTVGGQQFVMLDSSNAPDECLSEKKAAKGKKKKKEVVCDLEKNLAPNCPESGCSAKDYADQFAAMKPADAAWLVSHRPAWGFKNKGKPLNATLQLALTAWDGQLPPGFALAAAGHIHIWEALSFKDKGAPQFVLGNGGTLLTHKVDRKLKGQKVGKREVHHAKTSHKWGFTIFTPATDGWTATSYSVKGNDKFSCSVTQGAVSCP